MTRGRIISPGPVLVAGGNGFLGHHVASRFAAAGYGVATASRQNGFDFRIGENVRRCLVQHEPSWIVNCAAHVGGIAYNSIAPVQIYEDNLLIGFHLLRESAAAGIDKFVNVMPNCTYPGVAEVYTEEEWWDGPLHETVLTYGMPRKALWVQGYSYRQAQNFTNIHLVLPNLYGPGDHFDEVRSHALGALIRKIVGAHEAGSESVVVWGTGKPIREWMYVEDAAEGIRIAAECYNDQGILNLGSGQGCSVADLARIIADEVGYAGKLLFDPDRPDGAPRKIIDPTRMRALLDWVPPTELRDGIRRTVDWYIALRTEGGARDA